MTKQRAVIIAIVSLLTIFLSIFPHWHALKNTPPGYIFTGQAAWFDPWDISVYVAALRWGQTHGFLMENMYTTTPNQPIIYYPVYTLIGLLLPHVSSFVLFYAFSAVTTMLLVSAMTTIITKIFARFWEAFLVTIATMLSGGIGFLLFPQFPSLDTNMTSITFHSAFQRPHEGIAMAAFITALFGFYFYTTAGEKIWKKLSLVALCVGLILYPYNILSYFLIIGIFSFWQFQEAAFKKVGWYTATLLAISVVTVGIMAYNLQQNATFTGVVGQKLSGPSLLPFVWAYGFLLVPFLYQLFFWKPHTPLRKFLTTWVIVCVVLSVLPMGISRFFLRGMFVPLILLAALTLQHLTKNWLENQFRQAFSVVLIYFVLAVSITSLGIFYLRLAEVPKGNVWYYFTTAEAAALEYLDTNAAQDAGILAMYTMGNRIPTHTHQRVYLGHLLQTPDSETKQKNLAEFYSGEMTEEAAQIFIKQAHVQYVYLGNEEAQYSQKPLEYSFLKPVFSQEKVTIFQVQ